MGASRFDAKRAMDDVSLRSIFDQKPVWRDVVQASADERTHQWRGGLEAQREAPLTLAHIAALVDDHALQTSVLGPGAASVHLLDELRVYDVLRGLPSPFSRSDGDHFIAPRDSVGFHSAWTVSEIGSGDARGGGDVALASGDATGSQWRGSEADSPGGHGAVYGGDEALYPHIPGADPFFGSI